MFKIDHAISSEAGGPPETEQPEALGAVTKPDAARTERGESTRALILETALQMFLERGYEATTMRAIAQRAGVTPSHAYYYFHSKESLVQTFYAKTHREHLAASSGYLQRERSFEQRLLAAMRTKLETAMPYKHLAGALFRIAADPRSPLNPFSAESGPVRREAIRLFAQVVADSDARVRGPLAEALPRLLWLYHMGVLMYWVHDDSPGSTSSFRLVERTVELIVRLVGFAKLPPFRPALRSGLRLLDELGFQEGESRV